MNLADTPDTNNLPNRQQWLVAILSTGNFAIGMGAFIVIGIMTPMSTSLELSNLQAGLVLTIYALAYAVGSPLLIAMTGHLSRVKVLSIGMAVFMAGAVFSALASDASTLYASRILTALGAGLFTPVTSTVAMALVPLAQRGKALAQVYIGFTLAQVIGVPAGSFIGYTFGWQSAFVLVAVLCLICLIGVYRLVPANVAVPPNTLAMLGRTLTNRPVIVAILFTTSFIACNYLVVTLFAPLVETLMGYSRDGVSGLLVLWGVGAVVGNVLGGRLTDRFGSYRSLVVACLSQTIALPVFSFLPIPDVLLFVVVFFWAVFGWAFMVPQQARLVAASTEGQGVVLALNAAAVYIGTSIGSILAGLIGQNFGLQALGLAGSAMSLFGLFHLVYSDRQLRALKRQ